MIYFKVKNGQHLTRADRSIVAAGTTDLYAQFEVNDQFTGVLTAYFRIPGNLPYTVVLDDVGMCLVPWEVLTAVQGAKNIADIDHILQVSLVDAGRTTTDVCEIPIMVSAYMDESETATEFTPDQYEQLIVAMSEFKDSVNSDVEEFKTSVETDVSEFKTSVNKALATRAPAIVETASGNIITIADSSDDELRGLNLHGKTTQVTTTGAQLLNFPDVATTTVNGVTWSCKGGIVTVNGTATDVSSTGAVGIIYTLTGLVGTYYISGTVSPAQVYVSINKNDGTVEYMSNRSFTLDGTETNVYAYCQVYANYTVGATLYPMLNAGTTALPWEPYTGGAPAPSPDYPQELVSVGDGGSVDVWTTAKNLVDLTNATFSQCKLVDAESGKVQMDMESNTYADISITDEALCNLVLANQWKEFYFKVDNTLSDARINVVVSGTRTITSGGTLTYQERNSLNGEKSISITPRGFTAITAIRFRIGRKESAYTDTTTVYSGISFSLGDMSEFKPAKPIQTLTAQTPNGLPGIPVTDASLATYTDADGQMWVADEIDFARGVHAQRIGLYSLTDYALKASQMDNSAYSSDILRFDFTNVFGAKPMSPVKCNRIQYKHAHNGQTVTIVRASECISDHSVADTISVFIDKSRLETADLAGFVKWLQTHETKIAVILATPIETPLSAEELAAYAELHTNCPNTTVLNDAGAWMEVEYNADTKTYIDNKFAELAATLANS